MSRTAPRRATSVLATPVTGLLAVLLAGALGGCGVLGGGTSIGEDDLVETVRKDLKGKQASKAKIRCEGDLEGEEGATQDCFVESGTGVTGLRLSVTTVDGEQVKYRTTPFLRGDDVASIVADDLAQRDFEAEVTCDGVLPGTKDGTLDCTAAGPDGDVPVVVTTTEVDGLDISFTYAEGPA